MAANSDRASWSTLASMDPVPQPRLTAKADGPRLGDRDRDVPEDDSQYHPGWEVVVWGCGLVFPTILALTLVAVISTGLPVQIRFRR